MPTMRSVLPVSRIRRSRGFVALIVFVALFLLVPPLSPSARASGAWIVVDLDGGDISGEGWTPGDTATVTIDLARTAIHPDFTFHKTITAMSTFELYVGNDYWPTAGDLITVTDGHGLASTHRIEPLDVMKSDEVTDVVAGVGRPGATVAAWVDGVPLTTLVGVVDSSGRWSLDYTSTVDLTSGMYMTFREYDGDGNATQIAAPVPLPVDFDDDTVLNFDDNCPWDFNPTQYDGDGDGKGTRCDPLDRLWGANRYGTAAAVSRVAFDQADTVFIALGSNFPDALVAAAAGGYLDAPVLLTRADVLPPETIGELVRLSPHNAYLVGGTAVISPSVEQQLGAYVPNVMRLAGKDRYETAADVATKVFHAATEAFVALGTNFPDALVAAAPAGMHAAPVLLTSRDHVPAATLDVLAAMHPTKIYVVGGTAAISETAAQELAVYGPVERLAGANRYETAAVVSARFFKRDLRVLLAYGGNFPDALVAGAAGGHFPAPVLLVDHNAIPSSTRAERNRLRTGFDWFIGGEAAIGPGAFNAFP